MRVLGFCIFISQILAQEQPGPATGSLHGRVVDSVSGIGIPRAQVRLLCLVAVNDPPGCPKEVSIYAQPDGHFEFADLTPGSYGAIAFATGFVVLGTLASTDVKSNSVSIVDVRLDPEAKITGIVLTEDRKPVPDVEVTAIEAKGGKVNEVAKSRTNASGVYSLEELTSGNYYVRVRSSAADRNKPHLQDWNYYPNGFDLASATPVHLDPGQNRSGVSVSIRERPRFRVSGKIVWGSAPAADDALKLSLSNKESDIVTSSPVERLGETSKFDFRNVPAGHYTLQLVGSHFLPSAAGSNVSVGRRRLMARDTAEVTTHDIEDLVLRVPDPIKVTGKLAWDDPSSARDFHVSEITLIPVGEDRLIGTQKFAPIQADGGFAIPDCEPLQYVVRLAPHPGSHISSIVANGEDRTASYLDFSSTSNMQLNITLREGGGSLSGTVTLPSPVAKVRVTLIPSNLQSTSSLEFPSVVVGEDGKFALTAIRPGSYHAVASTYVGVPWDIPEVSQALAARGAAVTIGNGAHDDLRLELLSGPDVSTIIESVQFK